MWTRDYKLVIGGSDHGSVYIYDAETARVVKVLQHDRHGLVQTVAVRILEGSNQSSYTGF